MARWLFKEEPTHYSFSDLVRDRTTEWNGVHNALALRHLREAAEGDEVLYYHSGDVRAAVGIARVTRGAKRDTSDPRPSWSVEIGSVRPLARPVTLKELKSDPKLGGFVLFRIGRLSVLPVTDPQWMRILSYESLPSAGVRDHVRAVRPAPRSKRRRASASRTGKRGSASGAGSRATARRSGRGTGG